MSNVVVAFPPLTDDDIVALIRRNGSLDTIDIANRFGMSVTDARRRLRKIEKAGAIIGETKTWRGRNAGGRVVVWKVSDERV